MNSHKNARLTYQGRRTLVLRTIHEELPVREAAKAQGSAQGPPTSGLGATASKAKPTSTTRAQGQSGAQDKPPSKFAPRPSSSASTTGPTTPPPKSSASPQAPWPAS